MNKYKFCYRTTYTHESKYFNAESYGEALAEYRKIVYSQPNNCYLDYVFKCNENGDPIEIMYG